MEFQNGTVIPVTNVRVTLIEAEGANKAYVNITLGGCFVVNRLRVVEGENGLFVAMPQRKTEENTYKDVSHPITAEMRKHIQDVVLEEYRKQVERATRKTAAADAS